MIYEHKVNKKLVDTICSGAGWVCFVELGEDEEYNSSSGKVFKGSKSDFKKVYKKASKKTIKRSNKFKIPDEMKIQVEKQIQHDIIHILNDVENYIKRKRKENG